jgi:formylglycine-generating enzyme required for sulfatase activity
VLEGCVTDDAIRATDVERLKVIGATTALLNAIDARLCRTLGMGNSTKAPSAGAGIASTRPSEAGTSSSAPTGIDFGDREFALIPAGTFQMGSTDDASGEQPAHTVSITLPFLLQRTEVTQAQWRRVMGNNPSRSSSCGDTCPVELVSWNDIQQFLTRLNAQDPGKGYRLPTEAEWEYAARAGTTGDFGVVGAVCTFAWIADNNCAQGRTWPAAQKLPNAWGLYDMHGNVWEWVNDRYERNYYASSPSTNPQGPAIGSNRGIRGGSWYSVARFARSGFRGGTIPSVRDDDVGFRLARTP